VSYRKRSKDKNRRQGEAKCSNNAIGDSLFISAIGQDWLPEGHLARFVVEIVEQCNLERLKASYAGRGSEAYSPEMLVALLFYGYATGVFSSRSWSGARMIL